MSCLKRIRPFSRVLCSRKPELESFGQHLALRLTDAC